MLPPNVYRMCLANIHARRRHLRGVCEVSARALTSFKHCKAWSSTLNLVPTHAILIRAACGSNIHTR